MVPRPRHGYCARQAYAAGCRASFTSGGHTFDAAMQDQAWAFLAEAM